MVKGAHHVITSYGDNFQLNFVLIDVATLLRHSGLLFNGGYSEI